MQTKDNDDNINDQQSNEDNNNNKKDNDSSNSSIAYNQSKGNHINNIIKGNRENLTRSVPTYHLKNKGNDANINNKCSNNNNNNVNNYPTESVTRSELEIKKNDNYVKCNIKKFFTKSVPTYQWENKNIESHNNMKYEI